MAKTASTAIKSHNLRLDPYKGTHRFEVGDKTYKVDTTGAIVRKTLPCGLPVSLALPAKAFKGIAAGAVEDKNGEMTVTLELFHHDPELCIPLLRAKDLSDIAADWHSWSRMMSLPMLIRDIQGEASDAQRLLGEIMVETPRERRRRITTLKHRPNFLRRRKKGVVGPVTKISAAELVARH